MLTAKQKQVLLLADRTKNLENVCKVINSILAENKDATLFDMEMAFREAAAQTYLVVNKENKLHIVFGMTRWLEALSALTTDRDRNWATLQLFKGTGHAA